MNHSGFVLRSLIAPLVLVLAACGGRGSAPALVPFPTGSAPATDVPPTAVPGTQPAPGGERVAYIVAVVGDSAITNVALYDAVVQRFAAERRQPVLEGPEAERVRREVLEDEITELVLLQAAQKDTTIQVDE